MEAEVLRSFTKKYYLDGAVEEGKWNITKDGINVRFVSTTSDLVGEINVEDTFPEATSAPVLNTSALLSMIDIMDGPVDIVVEKSESGIPIKMVLNDNSYESFYHLGDMNAFTSVPRVEEPENYTVNINIGNDFGLKFIRGKGALDKTVNRCTIESGTLNKLPGLKVEIGSKESLSHKIKFFHEDNTFKEILNRQSFNADIIKSIFQSNKNFDSGTLKISNEGLMCITLISGPIQSKYFIVKLMDSD